MLRRVEFQNISSFIGWWRQLYLASSGGAWGR